MGGAIALLGLTPGSAIGAVAVLGAADAAVLARGFGPFTDYPSLVARLAGWIACGTIAIAMLVQSRRRQPLRNTARFAAAFSAAALFLKLLVLLHPNMGVGDTMFHAHKFEAVLAGSFYFTSIAPGGYAFPYPPGLYVFASLFAGLVRRGAGDLALLRIVCASADAVAGLLLYPLVVRNWDRRLAAAIAVAIYHLMPLNFGVLATGQHEQRLCPVRGRRRVRDDGVAVGTAGALAGGGRCLLVALLAAAFLSHTGTLATLFASAVCIATLFLHAAAGLTLRRAGAMVAIVTIAAAVIAVVVYYAHFMPTYRAEFARIGHETATAAPDAGGRTIGDRLRLVPYSLGIYIGVPVLLFAVLGAVGAGAAEDAPDRLMLALGGWMLACAAFLALGVLTPVDMRYYLAALAAVAIAAGYGAAWAWTDGWPAHRGLWRLAAAVFLAGTISTGFHAWWSALG